MNHFSIRLWCMMISGFYTTTGNDQLSDWPKKKLRSISQNQTCTPECHGHCFMVYCWSDPLPFSESRWNHYIREVLSKLMRCTELHTTPAANIVQQNGPNYPQQCPIASHTTNASKVERIGLWSFASSAIFTWPLTNYCFFKHLNHFLQGKDFYNQLEAENASQEFFESWSMDFMLNKLISHWQKCVDCNGSYFD